MKDSEVINLAKDTLESGSYNDDEILRLAFKIELSIRSRLSNWLLNNYQEAGSISDICDHIMDCSK